MRTQGDCEHIFSGQRGPLTTAQWGRLIKSWGNKAGLERQFAPHTARNSFVWIQHDELMTSITTPMVILNHSTLWQKAPPSIEEPNGLD